MCAEICDGAGMGICNGAPSTCCSFVWINLFSGQSLNHVIFKLIYSDPYCEVVPV